MSDLQAAVERLDSYWANDKNPYTTGLHKLSRDNITLIAAARRLQAVVEWAEKEKVDLRIPRAERAMAKEVLAIAGEQPSVAETLAEMNTRHDGVVTDGPHSPDIVAQDMRTRRLVEEGPLLARIEKLEREYQNHRHVVYHGPQIQRGEYNSRSSKPVKEDE